MREMVDYPRSSDRIWTLLERNSGGQTFELGTPDAIIRLLLLYLLALLAMVLGDILPALVRVPIIVVALTFVPGGLAVLLLVDDPTVDAMRVLYAYGSSLLILMFVGVLANLVLPGFGVTRPLTPVPLAIVVTLAVGVLAIAAFQRRQQGTTTVHVPNLLKPTPLGLLALPLGAILGVWLVNTTGNNFLLLVVLCIIAVLPLLAIRRIPKEWYTFGIWMTALAILYHKSLWQYAGFGGRPHGIKAWKAGRWSPGVFEGHPYTSELLQNGVLFPLYAHLSDVFILTQYEVINPLFVSFIPVAVFVAVREFVDADVAFLAAALYAFVHPFYLQYPTAGRAATPVIFLALFGVVLVDSEHGHTVRSLLAVLFLFGIVVSHYGTSYYLLFSLFLAFGVLFVLRQVNSLLADRSEVLLDGGGTISGKRVVGLDRRTSILSASLVLYFTTATIGWYIYMRGGQKFELLPQFVKDNFVKLISGPTVSGRTAARIQKDYGSLSIQVGKYIYITIAALMAIGFMVILYHQTIRKLNLLEGDSHFGRLTSFVSRRLSVLTSSPARNEIEFSIDEQYLVVASGVFAIFCTTIIFRNWGGGRPMMITFTFTTSFAVIGLMWVTNVTRGYGGRDAFAVLIAVLFLINTGVGAATVLSGYAPSNVPRQAELANSDSPTDQVTVHRDIDIATHLWLIRHQGGHQVYADTFGTRQYDWYRPEFAARTREIDGGYSKEHKPEVFNPENGRLGMGYLLILGHNEQLQGYWPGRFDPKKSLDDLRLSTYHKVYTNGKSNVYFSK